jgi:hypothetical protein
LPFGFGIGFSLRNRGPARNRPAALQLRTGERKRRRATVSLVYVVMGFTATSGCGQVAVTVMRVACASFLLFVAPHANVLHAP